VRRRRLIWGGLLAVLVLVGAVSVAIGRYLFTRGTSTPVPLQEIEDRYFASTSTSDAPGPSAAPTTAPPGTAPGGATTPTVVEPAAPTVLPVPGVYVYRTTGGDRIDALGGDHHDYPATTTITVTASGCGVLQRWDVLEERWEAWQRCVAAGGAAVSEPSRTNYDEFFAMGVRDDDACTGDARPLQPAAGATWTTVCTDEGGTSQTHAGTVVGGETRQVAGASVATLHVRVAVTDQDSRNQQVIDTWYLDGTDLVVAQTSTDHSVNSSPIGDVDYDEQYSIELTSLTPVTAS
jgi:hypothetical protein